MPVCGFIFHGGKDSVLSLCNQGGELRGQGAAAGRSRGWGCLRVLVAVPKFQLWVHAKFIQFSVWMYQVMLCLWLGGNEGVNWPGRREFRPGSSEGEGVPGTWCHVGQGQLSTQILLFSGQFWLVSTAMGCAWPGVSGQNWGWSHDS